MDERAREILENEPMTWKWIPGHEDRYQISSAGLVRSVDRVVIDKNGRHTSYPAVILTRWKLGNRVYVVLSKLGVIVTVSVQQLVAEAFLPNPDGLTFAKCKDGDAWNCHVSNLSWVPDRRYGVARINPLTNQIEEIFNSLAQAASSIGCTKHAISYAVRKNTKCKKSLWRRLKRVQEQS